MIWNIYAFIYNGVVKDTWHSYMGLDIAIMRARAVYGDDATAANCTYAYVQVGDTYDGNKFYHNGVEVPVIPSWEDYRAQLAEQSAAIDDLIIAITPEVYGNV